jgi:hypothetical protein
MEFRLLKAKERNFLLPHKFMFLVVYLISYNIRGAIIINQQKYFAM